MDIESKNASIETLFVSVRALTINGKQLTLAVFRQIPKGKESCESSLWGIVRYPIKDDFDEWLVFSDNARLFKRGLRLDKPRDGYGYNVGYKNNTDFLRAEVNKWTVICADQNRTGIEPHYSHINNLESAKNKLADHEKNMSELWSIYRSEHAVKNSLPQLYIAV